VTRNRGAGRLSWSKTAVIRAFDLICPLIARVWPRRGVSRSDVPRRITVLACWGIGDAVLLTPLLRALRRRYPNTKIELIGKAFLREIFASDPCVDEITVYAPPWVAHTGKYRLWTGDYLRLVRWLARRRRENNDWIVTTRGDIREHLFAAVMGGRRRFGYGEGGGAAFLTDLFPGPIPRERSVHHADCNREVARFIGCPEDGHGPRLTLPQRVRKEAAEFLMRSGWRGERPLLGVHVGAGIAVRRWPVERFQAVLEQVRARVGWIVLLGDTESEWSRMRLPAGIGGTVFSGRLLKVLGMLSHLDILLCNDGGIMHAAAALGARTVAIFGPGNPAWFRPYGDGHRIVIKEDMPCRPCYDYCSYDRPLCLESLKPEEVTCVLMDVINECARRRTA